MTKYYGISGIGSNVQLGKRGGYLTYNPTVSDGKTSTTPALQLFNSNGTTPLRLQIADPLTSNDAATKYYVDSIVQGLNLKDSVYIATVPASTTDTSGNVIAGAGNIPLTGSLNTDGNLVIDGTNIPSGSRVLIKDQTDETENGIYVLSINQSAKTYSMTRSSDADNSDDNGNKSAELTSGTFVFVETGLTNSDTGWVLSTPIGTVQIGTDKITFVQFSSAGVTSAGAGITKSGVTISVNPDDVTIYNDSTGKVSVKSGSNGLVMVSSTDNSAIWGQVDLTKGVTGILPISNGGTGIATYSTGDILVGTNGSLNALAIGSENQTLTVTSGSPAWKFINSLYTSNGTLTIKSNSKDTNTSYIEVSGSDTGYGNGYNNSIINSGATIQVAGTDTDINLTLSPAGNGIILARTGYSSYLVANYSSTSTSNPIISDDSLATVGFVMDKIIVPDTTRIYKEDSSGTITASVETNNSSYINNVVISSNNAVVATFDHDPSATSPAVLGEHLNVTGISGEVQLYAVDTSGTDNVDMRLIPQGDGFIYLGQKGSGLIKSEDTFSLTLSGGDGTTTDSAADIIIKGGDSVSSTLNGGDVIIKGGSADIASGSTSTGGDTFIKDSFNNNIIQFTNNNVQNAVNYLYIQNSPDSAIQTTSGLILGVSPNSATTNVSLYLESKGTGLIRVLNSDAYYTNLTQSGNNNALVTKQYVDSSIGGVNIPDGHGLSTYTDSGTTYRGVDFGTSNTVGFDSSYNIVVKSGTAGTVLISSSGTGTVSEATWGKINIATSDSITGTLGVSNGGTGIATYVAGDILYATSSSALGILSSSESSLNQAIVVGKNNLPQYQYISNLYDTSGNITLETIGVETPINYIGISNAATGNNPILSVNTSSTQNNYLSLEIQTGSSGLVYVNTTYTAALSDTTNTNAKNALVTKDYVDSEIAAGGDPLMIYQNLSSNFTQTMTVGQVKTAIPNKKIVVSEVLIDVETVLSGGSIDGLAIYVGTSDSGTKIMDIADSDVLSTNLYIKELNSTVDISGYQINVYFYEADGITLTAPTSGNLNVIVKYNII